MTLNQPQLPFDSGYSRETSLPAYLSNKAGKIRCKAKVLDAIRNGCDCLLKIQERLNMPQSSVSGRVNELVDDKEVRYSEKCDYIFYKGKLRKKILVNHQQ